MKLHDDPVSCSTKTKTCCGTADAADAQTVAQKLGMDFDSLDLRQSFKNTVFKNFIDELRAGRTPIPCIHCNSVMKFNILFKYANLMSCDRIATGHYVTKNTDGLLELASDLNKDQSYFLFAIPKESLDRLWFPLAKMTKPEVRATAESLGFVTAQKPESQNICFVPNGDYREIAGEHLDSTTGYFRCAATGKILGEHNGYWRFTVGQRKGLPSLGKPYYVREVMAQTNTVYLSSKEELLKTSFTITNPNWHLPITNGFVRVRHRAPLVSCTISNNTVVTSEPVLATPGQAAVFYSNNTLAGGGWIV
jgi:tRNA-specific 2-thiouridylase